MHTKKVRLSDSVIRSLERPQSGKRFRIWDVDIPGLLLEVSATQTRFIVRYSGEYKTLGVWPFIQIEVARLTALEMLREVELKRLRSRFPDVVSLMFGEGAGAPSASAPEEPPTKPPSTRPKGGRYPALNSVLEEYISIKKIKVRTAKDYRNILARYWPDYLERPLTTLNPNTVLERFRLIPSPSGANYSIRIIRALFRFYNAAHDDSLLIPTAKTLALEGSHVLLPRNRVLQDNEQQDWYAAVQAHAGPTARDLFVLIALTGLRLGEALGLRWQDINLHAASLQVRETKNGRPHSLPLGVRAKALLEARKAASEGDSQVVFAINPRNQRKALTKVVEAYPVEWSAHDLRRGFATTATRLLISDRIVKRLMNHAAQDVTGAHYIHLGPDALRPHMQAIEDALWGLWQGQPFPITYVSPRA